MPQANGFFGVALVGFCVATVACFLGLGARRGMLAALLGGTLFLPVFDAAAPARKTTATTAARRRAAPSA